MKAKTPKIKILFVCEGNTCRSPMAAVIFRNLCRRHKRTDVVVDSAGTDADVGADMLPAVKIALKTYGEKLPRQPYHAKQFTPAMQKSYQYIFTMHHYPDPYGRGQEAYDYLCCLLQADLARLYQQIFNCPATPERV